MQGGGALTSREYDSRPAAGVKKNDFGLTHSLVVKFAE
jgi:hypothetical protein